MSARVVALEVENRLPRQKLDQYIRHYFGGQRNKGLDKHQLELLLQGLPNVIALPTPETKTTTATRNGAAHLVRRMLAEDKLETQEIVIEPAEVQAQPEGWKKISEEGTSREPVVFNLPFSISVPCRVRGLHLDAYYQLSGHFDEIFKAFVQC